MNEQLYGELQRALQAARAARQASSAEGSGQSAALAGRGDDRVALKERPLPLVRGRFSRWHAEVEVPQEEEGWLVTYLDMMTLLLVMLVIMLAFSEPITRKPPLGRPDVVKQSAAIGQVPSASASGSIVAPLPSPVPAPGVGEHPPISRSKQGTPASGSESRSTSTQNGWEPLGDVGQGVQVVRRDSGVILRIPSEVLFASGEAELTPEGKALIDRLLPTLNQVPPDYLISVEGHTDNVPINNLRFPSNWELSAARAGSVVRHLERHGVNPTRLRASGLADTRPVAPNETPQGRALNRRVEITLEPPTR